MTAPGFTGSPLDRADALRHDPAAFAAAVADPQARLLVLDDLMPEVTADGMLGWTAMAEAPADAVAVLLGILDGRPHFAAWSSGRVRGEPTPMRSPAMTAALALLRPAEAAIYAAARSVLDWHDRNRFCANCGTATGVIRAGWGRSCPNCGAEHFPRVDPVVIMIADHEGRALLGRGRNWPRGRYSALAGFLEPGESIEEAVRRETREETGVTVDRVRYVASQPWPFPSSLMIACIGDAKDDVLRIDPNELEDAIWVSRADVRCALAGEEAPFVAPPPYAIAFTLLTAWAEAQ